MEKRCQSCRYWDHIVGLPFGKCRLPEESGSDGEEIKLESGRRFGGFGMMACVMVTTDMDVCSKHVDKPRES